MPAHLKQNKFGVWYLVDGYLCKSLKTKTKREAGVRLKQYQQGKFGLIETPTVQQFYDQWIAMKVPPLVRHSQVRDYKQAFNCYILPRFKSMRLADLKTKDLTAFQAELLKKGLAVKTARNIIDASFRAMFRDARTECESIESRDPFLDIKWPKVKREPPDPLGTDEKQKILAAFLEHEPFYYPFIRVQFETGMRPSETVALDWAHINTEARTIRIDKSRYLNADNDHPKTTHSGRTITVSRALIDLIVTLRHAWSSETDKVFLNKYGEPLNPASFRVDYWDRILEALKIRKRKFYATRHTFITEMVRKNINLKETADYTGTSVIMIEQHYCAKSELDPDREVFEKLTAKSLEDLASPTGFEPVLSA
jgi:integrase